MERGLSHVGPIVSRDEDCIYIGGNRRTQIKNMPKYQDFYSVYLSTLNGKSCAKMRFVLNHVTGGSIFLS